MFAELRAELDRLRRQGLERSRRTLQSAQGARVRVDGRDYLAFCSNDYLGLAADARVIEAARRGALRHGVGAGASHLVCGHHAAHEAVEAALAELVGMPRALLFSSGYLANLAAVTALVGREDAVFADRLNHASLNDACLLSRADFKRYPHCDIEALGRLLGACRARRKLIVTDAVFSMDGDIAPLPEVLALAERHDAWLLVDDAHGFGVLGPRGAGSLAHFGLASERVVLMGTLGKAAGVSGAFVAAQDIVVEWLSQRARPYVYTTAGPPLLAEALLVAIAIIRDEPARRERLAALVAQLRRGLEQCGHRLLPSFTAIQPLVVGGNDEALALAEALAQRAILVPAIRPPTVPAGSARLRISLSAAHGEEDIARLVDALVAPA